MVTIKTYQFTCAVRIVAPGTEWDGHLLPMPEFITPAVTCETPTQAIQHPDTAAYCVANKCVVYRVVT